MGFYERDFQAGIYSAAQMVGFEFNKSEVIGNIHQKKELLV